MFERKRRAVKGSMIQSLRNVGGKGETVKEREGGKKKSKKKKGKTLDEKVLTSRDVVESERIERPFINSIEYALKKRKEKLWLFSWLDASRKHALM